jgi:hypothetical protein
VRSGGIRWGGIRFFLLSALSLFCFGCDKADSKSGRPAELVQTGDSTGVPVSGDSGFVGRNAGWFRIKGEGECALTLEQFHTRYFINDHTLFAAGILEGEGCFEGKMPQQVRVTAYPIQGLKPDFAHPLWEVRDTGDKAEFEYRGFVSITEPGCCATLSTTKFYSLETGAYVGRGGHVLEADLTGNRRGLVIVESSRNASATMEGLDAIKAYLAGPKGMLDSLVLDSNLVPQFRGCGETYADKLERAESKEGGPHRVRLEWECIESDRQGMVYLEVAADTLRVGP